MTTSCLGGVIVGIKHEHSLPILIRVQVNNVCTYPSSAGVSLRVGLVLLAASAIYICATSFVNLYQAQ